MHLVDGVDQLVGVAQALLEQVGHALRPLAQQLQGVLGVMVLGEDHDAQVGAVLAQRLGQHDPLCGVGRGHAHVEHDHVDVVAYQQVEHLCGLGRGAHHVDLVAAGEHRLDALADQVVVLGYCDCDHMRPSVVVGGGATTTFCTGGVATSTPGPGIVMILESRGRRTTGR